MPRGNGGRSRYNVRGALTSGGYGGLRGGGGFQKKPLILNYTLLLGFRCWVRGFQFQEAWRKADRGEPSRYSQCLSRKTDKFESLNANVQPDQVSTR
ncbi:hypothetical protein pipiens_014560 [Culex pipiens pipiens]|uniref:Uncharacterized protein n=1 Tax=Culex pipiens pipiens TaxID=38569 RepID=A0ABD1CV55_CULPP